MPSKVSWALLGACGGVLNVLCGPPGASWGHMGPSCCHSQFPLTAGSRFGVFWGASWSHLGPSWGFLGACWAVLCRLGAPLGRLDAFLASLGVILGASRAVSDAWKTEKPSIRKVSKNQQKIMFFWVSRASWGCSLFCVRVSGGCLGPLGALVGPFWAPP